MRKHTCYLFFILLPLLLSMIHVGSLHSVRDENVSIVLSFPDNVDPWVKRNADRIHSLIEDMVSKAVRILGIKGNVSINITILPPWYVEKLGRKQWPVYLTETGVIEFYIPYEQRAHIFYHNITVDYENLNHLLSGIADAVNIYLVVNHISHWCNELTRRMAEGLNLYLILNTLPTGNLEMKLTGYPHEFTVYMIDHGVYAPIKELFTRYSGSVEVYRWEFESFTYWLIDKYGVGKYIELYKLMCGKPSIEYFKDVYGLSLDELEQLWLKHIKEEHIYDEDYEPPFILLALENTTIIYDDNYPLEEIAQLIKTTMLLKYTSMYSTNNRIVVKPYSKVKENLMEIIKKNNTLVITVTQSPLFKTITRILGEDNIGYCEKGFKFINKCYTSKNDALVLITHTKHGKALGVIIGNNANALARYIEKHQVPTTHPLASGCLYTNNSRYIIFPLALKHIETSQQTPETYNYYVIILVIAVLALTILTYIKIKHKR